jgi:hypothetical protein
MFSDSRWFAREPLWLWVLLIMSCADPETPSLDVEKDVIEELFDPVGESIVGETLAAIMCV